ncbi:alpha/beta fold hydrolase [Skermania piniformis]|uniref:Alpha/beta fold hydrolase n=1 Tax=Skermania pinensis TaxID=39122 RepID=A0ABX8S8X3_9ACTN|nr:alpha/beta fold hydrolase [Skermania piniformis]QXQ13916.1 alpha/beta fold hydrolase [Skermania piniformis]
MTTRHFVPGDDAQLAVFETGDPAGETIVLLHGWPDSHLLWDRVVPLLADRYRVLAVDNRGAGASSAPRDVDAYRIEYLAADVFAVIDALSPGRPVHLLGHDWGSVVGWKVVGQPHAPEWIASFTSVSGPNLDQLGARLRRSVSRPTPRNLSTVGEQAIASWYTYLFQVPGLPTPALRQLARHWPRFLSVFDGIDPAIVRPAPTLTEDMLTGVKLYRANIRQRLFRPDPAPVTVPVQLILSRGDRAVRPGVYADAEQWVRQLRRREIDARHWSPISHPDDLARLTAEFIGDVAVTPAVSES